MYQPKYETLIKEEEIELSELPTNIIGKIKGMRMQVNVTKNLPEEDAKYQAMLNKDEEICTLINAWLDDVVDDDSAVSTTPPKQEVPAASTTPPKQEVPAASTTPPKQEAPAASTTPPKQEAPATPQGEDHTEIIAQIKASMKGNRIHKTQLTQILGKEPNHPYHNLNGMKLSRVMFGDGWYQVS